MDQQRLILRERAERTNMLDGQSVSRGTFCSCVPSCPIGGVRASGVPKPVDLRKDVIPTQVTFCNNAWAHQRTMFAERPATSYLSSKCQLVHGVRVDLSPGHVRQRIAYDGTYRVREREGQGRWTLVGE